MTARRQQTTAWLIGAVALVLRLAWVAALDDGLVWPDERAHAAIAERLVAGEGFVATSYRSAPALPALLAAVQWVAGDGYLTPRVVQAILGALTCVLVHRTASLLVSPAVGTLSAALLAVYPPHVYLAGVFYTAGLEAFLCALVVWLAARVLRGRGGSTTAALCGVALGLTVLTRPVFAVLGPCLAAAWLVAGPRRAWLAAALLLGAATTVLPWTARNHAVHGRLLLVSAGGGTTLWKGNNPLSRGTADDRFLGWGRPVWDGRLARLPPPERAALTARYARVAERVRARERTVGDVYLAMDDVLGPLAREYMAGHPGRTLVLAARKVRTLFSAYSETATHALPRWTAAVAAVTFYPLLLLALAAVALGGLRAGLGLPWLVVAAIASVHAVLTSCTRFRLPVDPYLIMAAAFTVDRLRARLPGAVRWGRATRSP